MEDIHTKVYRESHQLTKYHNFHCSLLPILQEPHNNSLKLRFFLEFTFPVIVWSLFLEDLIGYLDCFLLFSFTTFSISKMSSPKTLERPKSIILIGLSYSLFNSKQFSGFKSLSNYLFLIIIPVTNFVTMAIVDSLY